MLNKIRKLREKKGFTLVELIVVIAIIAILTAVLVPLIGNWTQQAAYTTLQDGAQTISNSVNEAIAKITMGGAPASIEKISASKASSSATALTIMIDGDSVTLTDPLPTNASTELKIATEINNMLSATMSANSSFYAEIKNGAVTGVVYRNDKSDVLSSGEVEKIGEFNEAYKVGDVPVGVSGKFKADGVTIGATPTTPTTPET